MVAPSLIRCRIATLPIELRRSGGISPVKAIFVARHEIIMPVESLEEWVAAIKRQAWHAMPTHSKIP